MNRLQAFNREHPLVIPFVAVSILALYEARTILLMKVGINDYRKWEEELVEAIRLGYVLSVNENTRVINIR